MRVIYMCNLPLWYQEVISTRSQQRMWRQAGLFTPGLSLVSTKKNRPPRSTREAAVMRPFPPL